MITVKGNSAIYEGPTIDEMYTTGIDVNTLFHELNTNKWYYLTADTTWVEVPNTGGGGSGFTPTDEQLAAMNSGITATDVQQIDTNKTNILSISNTGTKNIIAPKLMDTPATGITMTVNADSTITVSSDGENTQSIVRLGTQDTFTLESGTQYVLTGCPSGGSQTTYGLMIALGAATGLDYGSGKIFTYNGEVSYSISIIVRAEQNIDNITFAPMIVKKTDYDAGYTNYAPCCMSLAEITRILKNQ